MERESGIQPPALSSVLNQTRWRIPALVFFMLWPWIWVSMGLFVLEDFRLTIMLYQIVCCALPFFLFGTRVPLLPLGLRKRWLIAGIVLMNVALLLFFKLTLPQMIDWPMARHHLEAIHLVPGAAFWLYGAFIVLFNPLFEEGFWRGTLYRLWREILPPQHATWLVSFFFGAWHWLLLQYFCTPAWAILLACLTMVGGVVFTYSYERTGSLGAAVLMHGLGTDLPLLFVVHTLMVQSRMLG